MTESLKPAYLEKIGQRGHISIWLVDGSYIRTNIDEEFTNFGQHYRFTYIPKDEFWIDQGASSEEQRIYIDHLLVEHRLMEKGVPYDQALDAADRTERAERKKAGYAKKVVKGGSLPDASQVHIRLWKKLETSVSVWIVNSSLVRSIFDVDFTEGGHDYVYEFVPESEVWIDGDAEEAERPFILLHELHERNLMAQGWDYDRAHADASRVEYYCRHHPEELHTHLVNENW
jgi:hypothetical protein